MKQLISNRRRSQHLRKNQTKEENHLWYDFLKTYPIQFRRQYQIGCYYADFYCYKASLVIELDGSQHTEEAQLHHDAERTAFLESQGLKVLRFYNTDIWKNFSGVCEVIDRETKYRASAANKDLQD